MKRIITMLACLFVLLANFQVFGLSTNVKIGFYNTSDFYQYTDESGKAGGYHVDLINALAKEESINIEYHDYRSAEECFNALYDGEVDAVISSQYEIVSYEGLILSEKLSSSSLAVIVQSDIKQYYEHYNKLPNNAIGGIEYMNFRNNKLFSSYRKLAYYLNKSRKVYNTEREMIDAFINKEIDFIFADSISAGIILDDIDKNNDYSIELNYFSPQDYYLVLNDTSNRLLNIINSGINTIRSNGQYDKITDTWVKTSGITLSERDIRVLLVIVAIIVVSIITSFFYEQKLKRRLEKEVNKRTAELTESVKLRNKILNVSHNGFLIINNGEIKYLNDSVKKYLNNYENGSMCTKVADLPVVGAIERDLADKNMSLYQEIQSTIFTFNLNGKERSFRYSSHPAGRYGYLVSIEDVTKEEARAKEIVEAEKNSMLNTLIAGIAHEIKNPLMVIQTLTSLISEQKDDQDFLNTLETTVPKETRRISTLIESLINYAKPQKKDEQLVNITAITNDVYRLSLAVANNYHCRLCSEIADGLFINGNADSVRQAILNFVLNSLDAINEKKLKSINYEGQCNLIVKPVADKIIIQIRDNGVGMDEEQLRKCKEPFYTTKAKGTGLGVPLAIKNIASNEGVISINSVKNEYTEINISFGVAGES